jgi:hypothetical protein
MIGFLVAIACIVIGHVHGWYEAKAKFKPSRMAECQHCGEETPPTQNKGSV